MPGPGYGAHRREGGRGAFILLHALLEGVVQMVHVAQLAILPDLFRAVTARTGLDADGFEVAGELLRIPCFE